MTKSAVVALIGRPSVGKSSLVNLLCKAKVAIVSPSPQTTRNAIRGIVNREEGQLVFIDTPGRHISEKKFNKKLMDLSDRTLQEAEIILYVLDCSRPIGQEEEAVAEKLIPFQDRCIAVINKIDLSEDTQNYHNFLDLKLPGINAERRFEISCFNRDAPDAILDCLYKMAPMDQPLYPEDYYTDQDMNFRISEIIREKAINRLRQELPHSIYVEVADLELKDRAEGGQRLWVRAFIITERESQKGMIVGKGGEKIKAIGEAARKELNRIFDWKVELDLRVKTGKDWRHNDHLLRKIIS